jgi:hypothetical protein
MPTDKLLFIDTNIWLDFYRSRGADLSIDLLEPVKTIANKLVVTYQIEMEFKKNRQVAMLEGIKELKPATFPRLGIFSNDAATRGLLQCERDAKRYIETLRGNLNRTLKEPEKHDPVYQACEELFRKPGPLSLLRSDEARKEVRDKAERRYAQGFPPRKNNDTSYGDAINWEWMVRCAEAHKADLVIVSRDSDYGTIIDKEGFINDALKHEFKERVGEERSVFLYALLANALNQFQISVPKRAAAAEAEIALEKTSIGRLMSETAWRSLLPPPPDIREIEKTLKETEKMMKQWEATRRGPLLRS